MKKRKEYYDGYLTVEASFLVPLVFMILLLLIYWGFYCYDKSVSIQCSYLAALRGSNQWQMSDAEQEKFTLEQLKKLTGETQLFLKEQDIYVDAGLAEMKTGVLGSMDILFTALRGNDGEKWMVESEKKAYRLKPASFIRRYRLLGDG